MQNEPQDLIIAPIPTGPALLILFVCALAIAGYIHFGIYGVTLGPHSWGRGLGEAIGAALGLFAIPAVVIVPWRAIQRRHKVVTNTPILVGTLFFAFWAALALKGAMMG